MASSKRKGREKKKKREEKEKREKVINPNYERCVTLVCNLTKELLKML